MKTIKIQDEIIGKTFSQNCGDSLLVISFAYKRVFFKFYKQRNKMKKESVNFYKVQFQKYSYIDYRTKHSILSGSCINPRIEEEEFLNKIWPQNCGDNIRIIGIYSKRTKDNKILYKYKFLKYPYIDYRTKSDIINGTCLNPRIEEEEFIKKEWNQLEGETIKILDKIYINNKPYYKVQYQKYIYEEFRTKIEIQNGTCLNPKIEKEEFVGKVFPQTEGDSVKVIEKTNKYTINKKTNKKYYLFKIEFQKYFYIDYRKKSDILNGQCLNPRIEEEEFIKKEWPQHCGDTLRILHKTNIISNSGTLFVCEFINYPYITLRGKKEIKNGNVLNPFSPYLFGQEENSLREYIKFLTKINYKPFHGKKEDHYYEIDIYLPNLKIGFEYNGSFWHQEGVYKPIDYHQQKFNHFLKKGIIIFNIWDYFWFENRYNFTIREEAKQYIKNIIQAFTLRLK